MNATWDDELQRFRADVFLGSVPKHGTHGCNYLLTASIEMDPLEGFKVANWESGFGDFVLRPDLGTIRLLPGKRARRWSSAILFAMTERLWQRIHGRCFAVSSDLLREKGLSCYCASELEFYLFNQSYH